MPCLGVHFALTDEEANRLLAAGTDAAVINIVKEEIERRWDEEWLQETGLAWDAIHHSLTDGTLEPKDSSPLSKCVLGGRQLYHAHNYIVSYLNPNDTTEVFEAIKDIDRPWLEQKYYALDELQTGYGVDEDDFEITWSYFEELKNFFQRAAQHGRAVIFTVNQ
jgi:hypothetical protein